MPGLSCAMRCGAVRCSAMRCDAMRTGWLAMVGDDGLVSVRSQGSFRSRWMRSQVHAQQSRRHERLGECTVNTVNTAASTVSTVSTISTSLRRAESGKWVVGKAKCRRRPSGEVSVGFVDVYLPYSYLHQAVVEASSQQGRCCRRPRLLTEA